MQRHSILPVFLLLALLRPNAISATQAPSPLFGPHAVLQRDVPVVVWGRGNPGEKITVRFNSVSAEGVTDSNGRWEVRLAQLRGGERGELIFESASGTVKSPDVIVGDVWLCAGQSNMERTVSLANHAQEEIAGCREPDIRQFKVPLPRPGVPQEQLDGEWKVASPQTVGAFTAVGYFCARDLRQINQLPQGLINCSWGGTPIEAWLSPESIASHPALQIITERWKKIEANYPARKTAYDAALAQWTERKKNADNACQSFTEKRPEAPSGAPLDRATPSLVFQTMLSPLIPYSVRGCFWYQGEANWQFPLEYQQQLHTLIKDWRTRWANEDLPFIAIQLPNFGGMGNTCWTELRRAQASIKTLPHTGVVTTIDVGDPKEVHPTNKQDVGKRLALMVRHVIFGEKLVHTGPDFLEATLQGNEYLLTFDAHGSALQIKESPFSGVSFEVAGVDHVFHPAKARLQGDLVIVSSDDVLEPAALRYCWRAGPAAILYNSEGLPAPPFRTDNWTDAK